MISPFHGGSHQSWAEGLQRYSRHRIEMAALPARFWKWRMHGGAVRLARQFLEREKKPDLLLATDMLDLTTFLALTRAKTASIPAALYMHENQLTYPIRNGSGAGPIPGAAEQRDLHYGFINYASMLVAERVAFNSRFHLESLLEALPGFLRSFPEDREISSLDALRPKCCVLPVGVDLDELQRRRPTGATVRRRPLILWNQRWEYDKNPGEFCSVLLEAAKEGVEFDVAFCGQAFQERPCEFRSAIEQLGSRVIHQGYLPREEYLSLLWRSDITISTADHEFFGISVMEAILCETFPILPRRLSYPELIPDTFHEKCLYESRAGLMRRLLWAVDKRQDAAETASELARTLAGFDWKDVAGRYDAWLEDLYEAVLST